MKSPARWGFAVDPHDGEAMDAYLERLATHMGASTNILLGSLGDNIDMRTMLIGRDRPAIQSLAARLGTSVELLSRLTLSHAWSQTAWLTDQQIFEMSEAPGRRAWCTTDGSAICPVCVNEVGIWQIAWRLPWIWSCPRHHCWLQPVCDGCGLPFRTTSRPRASRQRYAPTTCGNALPARTSCTATIRGDAEQLQAAQFEAQEDLLRLLHTPEHDGSSPSTDVRDTAGLLLAIAAAGAPQVLGSPLDVIDLLNWENRHRPSRYRRWALRAPLSTQLRALALSTSCRLVKQDVETTRNTIDALRVIPLRNSSLTTWIHDHARPCPTIDALTELAVARRGTAINYARLRPTTLNPSNIPQLMPEDLVTRFIGGMSNCSLLTLRAYASLITALNAECTEWGQAADLLNMPTSMGAATARAVHGRLTVAKHELRLGCQEIATELATRPSKINYHQMRVRLTALTPETVTAAALTGDDERPDPRLVHSVLWTTVAQNHPTTNPWTPRSTPPRQPPLRLLQALTVLAFNEPNARRTDRRAPQRAKATPTAAVM